MIVQTTRGGGHLGMVLVCTALALTAALAGPAGAAPAPTPSAVVETARGPIQGLLEDGIATFKGTPYGAPPTGGQRFLAPQPPEPWDEVLMAADYGAPAMQMDDRPHTGEALSMQLATVFTMRSDMKIDNEDCLYLNVWTPATDGCTAAATPTVPAPGPSTTVPIWHARATWWW